MGYKRSSSSIYDTISKLAGETVRAMAMQQGGEHGTTVPGKRSSASSKGEVEAVLSFLADAGLCTYGRGLGVHFDPYQPNALLPDVESLQVHFAHQVVSASTWNSATPRSPPLTHLDTNGNVLEIPEANCFARLDILQAPAAWSVPLVARRPLTPEAPPFKVQATVFGNNCDDTTFINSNYNAPSIVFSCYILTESDLTALSAGTWDPATTQPSSNRPVEIQETPGTSETDLKVKGYTVGAEYSKFTVEAPSRLRPQWVLFSATIQLQARGFKHDGEEEEKEEGLVCTARLFTLLKVPTMVLSRPVEQEKKALTLLWGDTATPPRRQMESLSFREIRLSIRRQLCAGIKNPRVRQALLKEEFTLLIQKFRFFDAKQSMQENFDWEQKSNVSSTSLISFESWISGLVRILNAVGDAYVDGIIARLDYPISQASRIAAALPGPEVCILCFDYDLNPGDLVAIMGGHASRAVSCLSKYHIPGSMLVKEGLGGCLARCSHLHYVYSIVQNAIYPKPWLYTGQYLAMDMDMDGSGTFAADNGCLNKTTQLNDFLNEIIQQQRQMSVVQMDVYRRLEFMENNMTVCGGRALSCQPPVVGCPIYQTDCMQGGLYNHNGYSQGISSTFKNDICEGLGDNLHTVHPADSSGDEACAWASEIILPSMSTLINEEPQLRGQ